MVEWRVYKHRGPSASLHQGSDSPWNDSLLKSNHLLQLLAHEYFIEFSYCEGFNIYIYIYIYIYTHTHTHTHTQYIKMIGAVLKLIIFTSMVNRIINTSRNERITQQVYDTLRHMAHIKAIVQFLPYSARQVRCDGLQSRGNSVLQIRYAHGLWWHEHFVLHVTPKEVVTRG